MRFTKPILRGAGLFVALVLVVACAPKPTSNDVQRDRSNKLSDEGVTQVGLPAIANFREFKILKMIYELRDQEGLVTYTYAENMVPTIVPGHTAMGGKFTFLCNSIGYPISAATQFTAPETMQRYFLPAQDGAARDWGHARLPQADPNALFSPSSTEGSWITCKTPGKDKVGVVYSEPRLVAFPYELPIDQPAKVQ